jgi:hypothetical protein
LTGSVNGYSYTVTMKADTFDFDAVGGAGPVYRASDGTLNDSGNGDPVVILTSTAIRGSYRAVQTMRVVMGSPDIEVSAALAANASVNLVGNITIDGRNHTSGGSLIDGSDAADTGACNENKAAVVLMDSTDTVNADGAADLECNPIYDVASPRCVSRRTSDSYVAPEDVLGLSDGLLDPLIKDADTYIVPDTIGGIVYVDGDYGSNAVGGNTIDGTGILIVHNPLYDPREHDPTNPLYDAAKASNPDYAPANLGSIKGGSFRGLIIADKIGKIDGNLSIIGAVVSLIEANLTRIGAGTAEIRYSCEALQNVANFPLPPIRLSWVAD